MTQEEKELLLKDLCARLPYGVKGIRVYKPEEIVVLGEIIPRCKLNPNIGAGVFCELGFDDNPDCCPIDRFRPYLRPMSSMTEEEREEYDEWHLELESGRIKDWKNADYIDWLNAHHFDYRGLIEKDLAIEAPEEIYNI